ncbi:MULTISPECIES: NDP-hexose 2,3-dehydratase family protein [Streptomyces]|uniref:NDP-hexose 2,3-dehydratase family protein n=1 Tax=Streptomyces griseiscabiei TaxID=2993540 RepID=A0ABU4LHC7_9ACTN|nr:MULTISPECIES: NDP-hexose 2,3-dehydratase family protein [Streptomyces]MBZ3907944.1 NDP-hexose 2,3-dehydratase family protein [Streptomyces griseiscabiei]MDX2915092.1 NDP-hexose 2,3-dehydratase family protein [Streptomyces griseiscabiei]
MTVTLRHPAALTAREDTGTARRIARSATAVTGAHLRTEDVADWLDGRRRAHRFRVDRIPFADLDGWAFDEVTGNLGHRSGRFFTVEGLHVRTDEEPHPEWHQPIIKQPEVGILGLLVKEFDGVLHFLMQAKMEPGNPNLLQLSPTVQATRSNYTKVHRGADVKYIDHFVRSGRGSVVADVLQSEHGSWFFRKSNRNMIVETVEDVPLDDDFCWLTLGQIGELLHRDNVVNMDSRTVLACAPFPHDEAGALHSDTDLLSWFTAERSRHDVRAERVPLREVRGWHRGESSIDHEDGRHFRVVALGVQAGNREVSRWTQPMFEPHGLGVTAFLTRDIGGVRHVLAHARVEGGFLDTVELGPTVQYTPGNFAHLPGDRRPPFLDLVLTVPAERVRYEAVHSEEGGRFLDAQSRYLLVDADGDPRVPLDPPQGYRWVTPGQLTSLVRHGHYVNVQARTLLACLNSTVGRT